MTSDKQAEFNIEYREALNTTAQSARRRSRIPVPVPTPINMADNPDNTAADGNETQDFEDNADPQANQGQQQGQVPNTDTISGLAPTPEFDKVFRGLSKDQRQQLTGWFTNIMESVRRDSDQDDDSDEDPDAADPDQDDDQGQRQQQTRPQRAHRNNQPRVTVNYNTGNEKPKYNPKTQTAAAYLEEVETFYIQQNYDRANYVRLFRSLLQDEMKCWYDNIKDDIRNWKQLKQMFKDKYDTWYQQQFRARLLYTKRQKNKENVADFIWEMVGLSKMVYPHEEQQVTVQRCRQALLPSIRVGLGAPTIWTIDELIKGCEVLLADLRDLDQFNNGRNGNGQSTNTNNNRGFRGNYRGRHFDSNFRGPSGRGHNRSHYNNNTNGNGYNNGYYSNNRQYNGNSNGNNGNHSDSDNTNNTNSNGRSHSNNFSPYPSNANPDMQCYRCHEFGHLSGRCQTGKSENGYAFMAMSQPQPTLYSNQCELVPSLSNQYELFPSQPRNNFMWTPSQISGPSTSLSTHSQQLPSDSQQ